MSAEHIPGMTAPGLIANRKGPGAPSLERETPTREFGRRFRNLLCELRLQPGIHQRIETLLTEFTEAHPNLRASYLSRDVDDSYFSDGSCGWEASARPKLQGIAIEGETLYEFLAFANGLRMHATPLNTIMNVEELWLEPAADQPFVLRACLFHSFRPPPFCTRRIPIRRSRPSGFCSV